MDLTSLITLEPEAASTDPDPPVADPRPASRLDARIRDYLEATSDCIYILDRRLRFTYLNRRAQDEIGRGRSLDGRPILDAFPGARDMVEEHLIGLLGRSGTAEFEFHYPELHAWYDVRATGIPDGCVVSFRNINERKQAEAALLASNEAFQLLARATNELIVDWDIRANRVTWSEALSSAFGYGEAQRSTNGWKWLERIHPDDRGEVATRIQSLIQSPDQRYVGQYRFRRGDGSYAQVNSRGFLLRDAGGRPARMVGAIEDRTAVAAAAEALAERERQLATVFGQAMVGILHVSQEDGLLMVNDRFCELIGRSREELRDLDYRDYTHPDDFDTNRILFERHSQTGEPFQLEKRYVRPDGTIVWCGVHVSFVRDPHSRVRSCIVIAEDISARKEAELALKESDSLSHSIVEASTDAILLLDLHGQIQFINEAGRRTLDVETLGQVYRHSFAGLWPDPARAEVDTAIALACSGKVGRFSAERVAASGATQWLDVVVSPAFREDGRPSKLVGIARDMTQQKAAEDRVRWAAVHDSLTGLPNRRLFQERLHEAIDDARAGGTRIGVLNFDLDHFKRVNDALGHDAGDTILKTFAHRLRSVLRAGDLVARLGGDEFAVILSELADEAELEGLTAQILDRMRAPFVYADRILDCRASIGASIFPDHGRTAEELIKNSDVALYAAKEADRGGMRVFRSEMRFELQKRSHMVNLARDAIDQDRVVPFYQPKIRLDSDEVVGFEALLRWRRADGRIEPPASIAAAFEDLEVASAISDYMVQQTVADMRRWIDRGIDFGHVAVNAAAAEFRYDNFAERVLEELRRAEVPTRCFQLEVTETVFLGSGSEYVERALNLLSQAGVTIALDDFGTGYASLRHLKQFPVDIIKIDQSFVGGLERLEEDGAIVAAVLGLGRSLRIETVAEGIETRAQAECLARHGCEYGQGYLFSEAIPESEVPIFLDRWRARSGPLRLNFEN